ncbi:MAG: glycoside hydrolase family 2 TIM barrel-domain containing protein [Chitinophagaceae bacterium]
MKKIILSVYMAAFVFANYSYAQPERMVWTKEEAKSWYKQWSWVRGSNFTPRTAINQLEMWQKESFDPATIDRELGFAESLGFNSMRVFLHHLAWQVDPSGFKGRMNEYLAIAKKHHISTMFVFFDDCWNESCNAGTQPAPKPGVHNSGWVRDPGKLLYDDPSIVTMLEKYVKDILTTFRNDKRIFLWDLYNEPGNSDYGNKSLPLVQKVFKWGRQVNPSQPLSIGVWNNKLDDLNKFQLENSDVTTYHNYSDEKEHGKVIDSLNKYGRPLICTEYMARTRGSRFENIMPLLKDNNVAAFNWGFVAGKTNTIYAWDTPMAGGEEPKVWFHDIFRKDGSSYSENEVSLIRSLTGKSTKKKVAAKIR